MEVDGVSVSAPTISYDVLKNADGSVMYKTEEEEVLVAVSGPAPVKSKEEEIDTATIRVTMETLSTAPSLIHNSSALRIERLLKQVIIGGLHPKSLIAINIQPMRVESGEVSSFAASLNASVCALMHAGIPMRSVPVAVAMGQGLEAVFEHTSSEITLLSHQHTGICAIGEVIDFFCCLMRALQLDKELKLAEEKSSLLFKAIQDSIYNLYKNK